MSESADPGTAALDEARRAADAERHLRGAVLWSDAHGTSGLEDVAEIVRPEDFAHHAHGIVYRAAQAIRAAGHPATAATVRQWLADKRQLADLGPNPELWLADLVLCEPNDVSAKYLAERVREMADKRRLRHTAVEVLRVASDPAASPADALAECERILLSVGDDATGGAVGAADLMREELNAIDDRASADRPEGVGSGLADFDKLAGGLRGGQLVVIGARPGIGKTSLALAIGTNAKAAGMPVLFFSLEMSRSEIAARILAMRGGVPLTAIRTGRLSPTQTASVIDAAARFEIEPFVIDDSPGQTVARIAAAVRRAVRRRGVRLVVIDYLGLISPENPRDARYIQIGNAARQLKLLARACDVPVLLLSQLNREVAGRPGGKPQLSDLRDSGEVEQHCDMAVLLHKDEDQPRDALTWRVSANFAKHRAGATGEISLTYRRMLTRFENLTVA